MIIKIDYCTLFLKENNVAVCQVRRDPRGEAFPLHWLQNANINT